MRPLYFWQGRCITLSPLPTTFWSVTNPHWRLIRGTKRTLLELGGTPNFWISWIWSRKRQRSCVRFLAHCSRPTLTVFFLFQMINLSTLAKMTSSSNVWLLNRNVQFHLRHLNLWRIVLLGKPRFHMSESLLSQAVGKLEEEGVRVDIITLIRVLALINPIPVTDRRDETGTKILLIF